MDYSGIDYKNIRYSVNRPLTDEERKNRYFQKKSTDSIPMDFLSVIRLNSSYIELVDRWYPIKGFNTWVGWCIIVVCLGGVLGLFWALLFSGRAMEVSFLDWALLFFFSIFLLILAWGGKWLVCTESWRWTHYPVRLNRKNRQVYVFRQNGSVLTVPWDDLFITLGKSKNPLTDMTYDLRAHVMDGDGETVRETFSLGYASLAGNAQSIDKFWSFLQPYMEDSNGVERTYRYLKNTGYMVPVDGRKEGFRWSIARSFMLVSNWPWLQLLGSPLFGMNALGRMFAMWTSNQPAWPKKVEALNAVDLNDAYVLNWRENKELGWKGLWWPAICAIIGLSSVLGGFSFFISTKLNII